MKTKTADWENRLNEILAEHMAIYGAEEGEGEYCRDLHDFIKSLLSSQKAEILDEVIKQFLTNLHQLRANIPLTYGKHARDMAERMIKKWKSLKENNENK